MAAIEATVNKVTKELKLDSISPNQQTSLQESIKEYILASQKGEPGKKEKAQKNLENAAKMCKVKMPDVMNALKKAGIN